MTTPLAPIPPPAPKPVSVKKPPIPSWTILALMVVVALGGVGLILRTPEQTTSILSTLLTPLGLLAAYWQSLRNAESIQAQYHQTNSRMDDLLAVTREAAHAQGNAEGLAQRDPPSAP